MCLDVDDKIIIERNSGAAAPRRLRVAVAGLGVIGEGAALRLAEPSEPYALCAALVRNPNKPRNEKLARLRAYTDPAVFLVEHPDVVIDALPSGEAGRSLIEAALKKGISIVTANKQAIAGALAHLSELAAENSAAFSYSASVGGGAPIIETVRRASAAGEIKTITAILNGTVNYILSAMKQGASFDAAVSAAQEAGFAEPDPTADLSGEDARAKIAILSYEAFGEEITLDAIELEALDAVRAAEFLEGGGVWKQLAVLTKTPEGRLAARVSFERVDDDPFFRNIEGEGNALRIVTADGRAFTCEGKGAGREPTVASIFADLAAIAQTRPFR